MAKVIFYKCRLIGLLLLILTNCISTNAQQLAKSRSNSYYTVIYSLDVEQAKRLITKENYVFPSMEYFESVIDSFPNDSSYNRNLDVGHYLFVKTNNSDVNAELVTISDIQVDLINNDRDLILFIHGRDNCRPIDDAIVKVKRKIVPFNSLTGNYELFDTNKTGLLTILVNGETIFLNLTKEYVSYRGGGYYSNNFYKPKNYKGYLITNKPKYLPNDTVKWKAFVTNDKGKPYKKPVSVRVKQKKYGGYYETIEKEMMPITDGAYFNEFVLGDSLKLNYEYTISLLHPRTYRTMLSTTFSLEDYQLDETKYNVRIKKDRYYYGEPIEIFLKGIDANGLNLLDTRAELTLTTVNVDKVYGDDAFIANQLFVTKFDLDPIGETKIVIPDSVLPDAKMQLQVDIVFNNSNNETHEETRRIDYNGEKIGIQSYIDGDSLMADYMLFGENTQMEGVLVGLRNKDTITHDSVKFPFAQKINPLVSNYQFYSGKVMNSLDVKGGDSQVVCVGQRVNDSVFVEFINPRNLEIFYHVFDQKNRTIAQGTSICLDTAIFADNYESYFISCSYMWAGNVEEIETKVFVFDKKLFVDIKQPRKVYPGQKVDVTIKVTDIDNNPVKDVNICASAINNQFGNFTMPAVPYFGDTPIYRPSYRGYELDKQIFFKSKPIDSYWYTRFRLDTIPYYKIILPEKGYCTIYDSTVDINKSQFSPYVFRNGYQQDVYLIYIDDELIYYSDNDNHKPYSFVVDTGMHNVRIRTSFKEFTIDSIYFVEGKKLELSIDYDKTPDNIKVTSKKLLLTEEESFALESGFLQLKNNFYGEFAFLKQYNNVVKINHYPTSRYYRPRLFKLGPYEFDSVEFVLTNRFSTKFPFEPGYEYTVNKGLIKMEKKHYYSTGKLLECSDPQSLGDIFTPVKVLYNNEIPIWDSYLCISNIRYTIKGNGTFSFEYEGDSIFSIIRIIKKGGVPKYEYNEGSDRTIYNLSPGTYSLYLITEKGIFYTIDSINIMPDGISFKRIQHNELKLANPEFKEAPINLAEGEKPIRSASRNSNYFVPNGKGELRGVVVDVDTGEPIPFANVILERRAEQVGGSTSDFDGNYAIKPISPGIYDLRATFVGYKTIVINGVRIVKNRIRFLDIELESSGETLEMVQCIDYKVPLISMDRTSSGATITASEISKMPNRSANVMATTVGGVFSNDQERGTVRGARSDETVTYIDGIRIVGNNTVPQSAIEMLYLGRENSYPGELQFNVDAPQSANRIRNSFVDYAYWQPNMITNELGEVSYTVTFPDNITSWETYALAMGSKKQTGTGRLTTLSFSDLLGQLSTPRFLLEGDSTNVICKIANYNSDVKKVTGEFRNSDKLIKEIDTVVVTSVITSIPVQPVGLDTLDLIFKVVDENGLIDGEERHVPVFPVGVKETKGEFFTLVGDTSISLSLDSNNFVFRADASEILPILDELKILENYPYHCMEQSSSKLIGLLMERDIRKALDESVNKDYKIKSLIRRLKNGQNKDGGWGWWSGSNSSVWMTSYVVNALSLANSYGFKIPELSNTIDYIKWHLDTMEKNELLYSLTTLSNMDVKIPYANYLRNIEENKLNLYQKLSILKIKQNVNLTYSIDSLLLKVSTTYLGNYYWGEHNYRWYDNSNNITVLAYQIIEAEDSLHSYLPKIRNYFMEIKADNKWRNTIEKAQIISTILPSILIENKGELDSVKLNISGEKEIIVEEFPFQTTFSDENIEVHKSGLGTVFITSHSTSWNPEPVKNDSLFEVNTWFEKDGIIIDSLVAGEITELKVSIQSKRKGEYIMIEVPIPAGCSYGDNKQVETYVEGHREYFKNKTAIFCESINEGLYEFTIRLQPRFSGKYNLNPVLVELMYFPTHYGRNEVKEVNIR